MTPIRVLVKNVKWLHAGGEKENDLGQKHVTFTYLRVKNTGRVDAEDCVCTLLPHAPEVMEDGDFYVPVELPLVYSGMIGPEAQIIIGSEQAYEIGHFGRSYVFQTSKTIPKRGGEATLLLAFVVEGVSEIFMGITGGTAMFKVEPTTITIRTSTDGKLHEVRLEPTPSGSVKTEVLS